MGSEMCIRDRLSVRPEAVTRYALLHRLALRGGVWLAPSAWEVAFVSLAHDEAGIDAAIKVLREALATVAAPA